MSGDNSDIILKKKDSYNISHLHAHHLVSDVELEVVVAHHLYVVEQAHDETADAVHDTTPQKVEQAVIMLAMAN